MREHFGERGYKCVTDYEMLKIVFNMEFGNMAKEEFFAVDLIDEDFSYYQSFREIQNLGLYKKYVNCYREGETRRLVSDKIKVVYLFIICGNYHLYFKGKSKKGKLSGVEYTLCE